MNRGNKGNVTQLTWQAVIDRRGELIGKTIQVRRPDDSIRFEGAICEITTDQNVLTFWVRDGIYENRKKWVKSPIKGIRVHLKYSNPPQEWERGRYIGFHYSANGYARIFLDRYQRKIEKLEENKLLEEVEFLESIYTQEKRGR